ncbi:MAG: OmpA family protein [Bacteroidia bacterium]
MTPHRYQWLPVWTLFLLLVIPIALFGQNTKTAKTLDKARQYFRSGNVVGAEELYQQVLSEDPNNFEAAYQLGQISNYLRDYREALRWYRKASEIDPNRNDTVYLQIGLTYKLLNNYRLARESFQEFLTRHKVQDDYYQRAEREIAGCDFAEASLAAPPDFYVKPASFNSEAGDRLPAYLDQRQEDKFLVFVSERPLPSRRSKQNVVTGEPKDSDLYSVVLENDSTFGADVVRFPYKVINFEGNDGPASFTGDGLTMYFSICNSKKNKNGCSIYESRYNPSRKEWEKPVFIESLTGTKEVVINSRGKTKRMPTDDRQPFVTRDGRTLFFVSDRGAGEGGFDIWYSRKVGAGWSPPQNLGPNVNTPFNEATPFFNDAGNKLYFASDGWGGFGGYDIYASEGTIDNWKAPVNLGAPVNSTYNDVGSIWMDDDSLVYFTSNRPGGPGSYDIYWGRRIYYSPDRFEIAVKGTIRDKQTKLPVPFATAILYEYQDESSIMALDTFNTDQDARYEFPLKSGRRYKILGNAREYLANEEEVSTEDIFRNAEIVKNIDIELEPIVIDSAIVLQNIYYDFDKYYIREDAIPTLNKLVKLLYQNPNITIQLGSHTDSNGSDPYNKGLSENRARAVVKYLAENGIDPGRLLWFGFGESQPLIFPETNDQDEQANRRTEFRITSIDFR